jgi:hypothetical protein
VHESALKKTQKTACKSANITLTKASPMLKDKKDQTIEKLRKLLHSFLLAVPKMHQLK